MFNQYPYINENDLNLDYILKSIKKLKELMDNFITLNSVTFADPIIWNISTQYARNTVVLDPSGNAYLSKMAVPAGVQLNNSDYWLEIFNFTDYTRTANQNLTVNVETNTTRATAAYAVDDWLIWNDVLYKVTTAIAIDDALVIGTNLVHFTVEDFIKAFMTWATNTIQQYKNDIDASELLYRQQLAGDIANTTASLQAQLDAAISGATVDSEVILARVGWNGVTYSTLGDAIRTQIKALLYRTIESLNDINLFEKGSIDGSGIDSTSHEDARIKTPMLMCCNDIYISPVASDTRRSNVLYYNQDGTFNSLSGWNSYQKIPKGSVFRIILTPDPTSYTLYSVSDIFDLFYISEINPEEYIAASALTIDMFKKGLWNSEYPNDVENGNTMKTKKLVYVDCDMTFNTTAGAMYISRYTLGGEYINTSALTSKHAVKRGELIAICVQYSSGNQSITDIYNVFHSTPQPIAICENLDRIVDYAMVGSISASDGVAYGTNTIIIGLIRCKSQLLAIAANAGYKFYVIAYDPEGNVSNASVLGGWKTDEYFVDTSDYAYLRIAFRKSDDSTIDISEIVNIKLLYANNEKYVMHNIDSICKDGINNSYVNYCTKYPESSIISYKKALAQGFRSILVHIQYTSDGYAVLHHDVSINATARNIDGTTIGTTINIGEHTLAELDSYDFGIAFGYAGLKITRFAEFLELAKEANIRIYIEPTVNLTEAQENDMINQLKSFNLHKTAGYFAYTTGVLSRYHSKVPDAPLFRFASDENDILNNADNLGALNANAMFYAFSDITIDSSTLTKLLNNNLGLMIQAKHHSGGGYVKDPEPDGLRDIIDNIPYVTGIVSEFIPTSCIYNFD